MIAGSALGQMGANFRRRDRSQVRQSLRFAPMAFQEGQIEPPDMAVGFQRPGRQPPLMGQMLQPGGQGFGGGQLRMGHRSAVRSTTRAIKATSSQPILGVKPSSSGEPKAHMA